MQLIPGGDSDTWNEHYELLDDTVASLAYAIRTRLNGSSQEAAWSARRAYEYADSIASSDFARQGVKDPTYEMLLNHYETQKELRRQQRILKLIAGFSGLYDQGLDFATKFLKTKGYL